MPAVANVHRWFRIRPCFNSQPAELAKFPMILFLSWFLAKRQGQIESFWQTILPALPGLREMSFLIVIEPDLGNPLMFLGITVGLLFFAGMPWKYFAMFAMFAIPIFYFLVFNVHYRRERIFSFVNPETDA